MGDIPCDGVTGRLDVGVAAAEFLLCLMCFLAVWCQFLRAVATLSLNIVGFMLVPICLW